MTKQATAETAEPTPFALYISKSGRGRTHKQLTEALHLLIASVQDIGAGGTLTLKIGVKPLDSDGDQIAVTEDVILTLPRMPSQSIYFVDGDGNPTREDPSQMAFGIDYTTGEITP